MIVRGITIHNTGNGKSARELFDDLYEHNGLRLCHFLVDEQDIIQTIPLSECAEHTGKGYDMGNLHTIAIEICRSTSDENLYMKAQEKAIDLIKALMWDYELTTNNLYFHNDFNKQTYCPHRILQIYGSKMNFIKEVFYGNSIYG